MRRTRLDRGILLPEGIRSVGIMANLVFGAELQENALLPENNLEQYDRRQVQPALEHATRNCGERKAYKKGRRSFQVLESLNPNALKQHLPHFRRFTETLEMLLR